MTDTATPDAYAGVPRYNLHRAKPGDTEVNADILREKIRTMPPGPRRQVIGHHAVEHLTPRLDALCAAVRARIAERAAEEATQRGGASLSESEHLAFTQQWLDHSVVLMMLVDHDLCQILEEAEQEHYAADSVRARKAEGMNLALTMPFFFQRTYFAREVLERFDPENRGVPKYAPLVPALMEPTPEGALCVLMGSTDTLAFTLVRLWVTDVFTAKPALMPLYTQIEDEDLARARVMAW